MWKARSMLALALGLSCAGAAPAEREAERLREVLEAALAQEPADPALRVLLAFGSEADLDLYVTDPLQETVYFANSPSAAGGRLEADLHCGSEPPGDRIEQVRFAEPPSGSYRVGVDYPKGCGRARTAAFALAVVRGDEIAIHTGALHPLEFRLAALDFEIPEAEAAP
jgi:uncharacterized protein YfaP (DUF2135 family)